MNLLRYDCFHFAYFEVIVTIIFVQTFAGFVPRHQNNAKPWLWRC